MREKQLGDVRRLANPRRPPARARTGFPRSPCRSPMPRLDGSRLPPSASTRSSASATLWTAKYGSEKESPGPRPRAWMPTAGAPECVCQPSPCPAWRSSISTPSRFIQKRRARSGSSAGNSISDSGGFGTARTIRADSQSGSTRSAGSGRAGENRPATAPRRDSQDHALTIGIGGQEPRLCLHAGRERPRRRRHRPDSERLLSREAQPAI